MTSDANPPPPLRTFPAHYGVAALAAMGALAIQSAWPTILTRPPAASWWPLDACVVISATGYLATTAWMHATTARWRPQELLSRLWRLGRAHVIDVAIGLFAAALFIRGEEASNLRAGLWLLFPILLTVSIASLVVGAIAIASGFRQLAAEPPQADRPHYDFGRWVCALALALSLLALERSEPRHKPWEAQASQATSHSVHYDELGR